MYPKYSLQLRHHIFSFLIAVTTFILYCTLSIASKTILGIEYTFNSIKVVIVENGNLVDNLTTMLLSNNDQQILANEINNYILKTLNTNEEFNNYTKHINFGQIDVENITSILNTENLSVKEKSLRIIDLLFETYIKEFTRTLRRIWWTLLIVMIIVQLLYFATMIYIAECKTKRNNSTKTQLYAKTSKRYSKKPSDYRFRK